jgi:hypothetical protein
VTRSTGAVAALAADAGADADSEATALGLSTGFACTAPDRLARQSPHGDSLTRVYGRPLGKGRKSIDFVEKSSFRIRRLATLVSPTRTILQKTIALHFVQFSSIMDARPIAIIISNNIVEDSQPVGDPCGISI